MIRKITVLISLVFLFFVIFIGSEDEAVQFQSYHSKRSVEHHSLVKTLPSKLNPIVSDLRKKQKIEDKKEIFLKFFISPHLIKKRAIFIKLRQKALLNDHDHHAFQEVISDKELIHIYSKRVQQIKSPSENHLPRNLEDIAYAFYRVNGSMPSQGEVERMESVDFLITALECAVNQNIRKVVHQEIENILLNDNLDPDLKIRTKRGVIGDRIELFSAWRKGRSEEDYQALLGRADDSSVYKILLSANDYYQAHYRYAHKTYCQKK